MSGSVVNQEIGLVIVCCTPLSFVPCTATINHTHSWTMSRDKALSLVNCGLFIHVLYVLAKQLRVKQTNQTHLTAANQFKLFLHTVNMLVL